MTPIEDLEDALDVWEKWALEPEELAAIVRARRAIRQLQEKKES